MQKLNVIVWGSLITFAAAGLISTQVITRTESIESLLQVLAVTILIIILVTRFVLPRFQEKSPQFAYFIQFAPLSLFVYLLVFSTGGLASPFLILTHLFAIGMAFLITPAVSMAYVFETAFFLIINIASDPTSQELIADSPFAILLYALAYGAILPFSQYIAKIYKQKDAWVNELSQMLVTSKQEEERLLKNIEDPVVVISRENSITFVNKAVNEKLGYKEGDLSGKNFAEALRFKDNTGNNLPGEKLPIAGVLATKNEARVDKLQVLTRDGTYKRVNIKILPVIEHTGEVPGIIVIFKEYSEKEASASDTFEKVDENLSKNSPERLEILARDLLLTVQLESQATEGLSEFIDISKVLEKEMLRFTKAANSKKVKLSYPSPANTMTLPKSPKVLLPERKASFESVFTLASQKLLTKAFDRIYRFALIAAKEDTVLESSIEVEKDVVKIIFSLVSDTLTEDKIPNLFNKFGSQSTGLRTLSATTGLEIPIAENIFEKHGGNLKIEKQGDKIIITANIVKPEVGEKN